eukprot:CAMPEP_0184648508 /NCGR_PEP_ID=MMETSP0308-20130426/5643_1 /TAXON_ID=38269 /ORGANISM="Gloeochaete witrockiana, Strain SAG 46.84" /LENGTH=189 /DNA_ID=CAMNT_0027080385 /DNA_START=206 /DNA_END=775 /DNA_ORIENTATION=-
MSAIESNADLSTHKRHLPASERRRCIEMVHCHKTHFALPPPVDRADGKRFIATPSDKSPRTQRRRLVTPPDPSERPAIVKRTGLRVISKHSGPTADWEWADLFGTVKLYEQKIHPIALPGGKAFPECDSRGNVIDYNLVKNGGAFRVPALHAQLDNPPVVETRKPYIRRPLTGDWNIDEFKKDRPSKGA